MLSSERTEGARLLTVEEAAPNNQCLDHCATPTDLALTDVQLKTSMPMLSDFHYIEREAIHCIFPVQDFINNVGYTLTYGSFATYYSC